MALLTRVLLAAVAFAALVALPAAALPLTSYSNLFVFGDSLVDAGNTQQLLVGLAQPDPTPAAAGYFDGRFQNGPNFADVVNVGIEGTNSDNSLAGGDNFAYGGARARATADIIPDLQAQVSAYSAAHGGVADPNALYMINVGGNDIFDILSNPSQAAVIINAAVTAISTSVLTLQSMGATAANIWFVGVGDVGSPPSANGFEAIGRQASIGLNNAILANLPAGTQYFNTIGFFDAVNANPTAFGLPAGLLTEVSCLNGGGAPPGGPPVCDNYVFFDSTHPTTQVSQVAGIHGLVVAIVPEPGTGLLVAFGIVGIALRRRSALA
jgi:phospholipase/lecithinase/hemolysin